MPLRLFILSCCCTALGFGFSPAFEQRSFPVPPDFSAEAECCPNASDIFKIEVLTSGSYLVRVDVRLLDFPTPVEVLNVYGEVLKAQVIEPNTINNMELDLSSLPVGVYYLRIADGGQTISLPFQHG